MRSPAQIMTAVFLLAVLHAEESETGSRLRILEQRVRQLEALTAKQQNGQALNRLQNIEMGVSLVTTIQGSTNVDSRVYSDDNLWDGSYSADIEFSSKVGEHGNAYLLIEAGDGEGVDDEISTWSTINASTDNDSHLHLSELWYEHAFFNEQFSLKFGKIDLTGSCGKAENAFDANAFANDECSQFLSDAFVNNPLIEFPDDNGLGMAGWLFLNEQIHLGLGVAEADADWEDVFNEPFVIMQLSIRSDLPCGEGNYRFYAWFNNKDHIKLKDPAVTGEKGYGWGISFDQKLSEAVGSFLRVGVAKDSVYETALSWSTGLELAGKGWSRPQDRLGLAIGRIYPGQAQRDIMRAAGISPEAEDHVECYYRYQFSEQCSFSPDIQWVNHATGDGAIDPMWLFGLRMEVTF